MRSAAKRHDRAGLWRLVLVLLLAGVLGGLTAGRRRAGALVAREEAALGLARRVLAAESGHRQRLGRYAWLEELAEGGRLGSDAARLDDGGLVADGYRIDVLLPSGRGPLGEVLLALRSAAAPDALLAARHVAILARPVEPGRSGWRTYYLDETGRVFVSEGVCDAESALENGLPRARVESAHLPEQAGPVWRPLDDLEAGA